MRNAIKICKYTSILKASWKSIITKNIKISKNVWPIIWSLRSYCFIHLENTCLSVVKWESKLTTKRVFLWDWLFNFRSGCTRVMQLLCFFTKLSSLKFKQIFRSCFLPLNSYPSVKFMMPVMTRIHCSIIVDDGGETKSREN